MSENLAKSKFCLIKLVLLAVLLGGAIPAFAFQEVDNKISPWEKPISKCWTYEGDTAANIPMVPAANGFLYIPLADGAVAAIETARGKQVWQSGLGGEIRAMQLTDSKRLIVVTEQQSDKKDDSSLILQAISEETGVTTWRKELAFSSNVSLLIKGNIAVLIGEDGNITAFNTGDGEVLWRAGEVGKIAALSASAGKSFIVIRPEEKKLVEMNLESGKAGQTYALSGTYVTPKLATGDLIVFSDGIGNISAMSLLNGAPIWNARAGAEVSDVSATDLGLLVSSNDNFVYLLSASRGDRKWKRKFAGRLMGKPVLHENYGLFVTAAGTDAVILNLNNGKFVNGVSLSNKAFFTGSAVGAGGGFALSTSQGVFYYSPDGCPKK
ncbi:MAG TPA: PQQ-binding-like beta-propeller repeat protein [Pyrinomonadaceae bacterium]|jgi:outer membrane protein assembly factor BamB|nr:PQQ-binding-like beta-propeller repeat protein [Pyrinomonadaceae bacterium]